MNLLEQETEQALLNTLARFDALQRTAEILVENDDLPSAFQSMLDCASRALGARSVVLSLFDLPRRRIELVVRGGFNDLAGNQPVTDNLPEISVEISADKWQEQQANLAERLSVWADESAEPTPWTTITMPIIYGEQILGIIKANNPPQSQPFTQADETLLAGMANQAALAIESDRVRRLDSLHRRQSETLQEVTRTLNFSLDQQHVLEQILDQLARVIDYDSASIMLISDNKVVLVAHRKLRTPEQLGIPGKVESLSHIQEVIQSRKPVIIEDTLLDPRWHKTSDSNYIRNWLGVPLIGRDQVIGLLNLDKEQPNFYSNADGRLALTFAYQAAMAIENARLYSIERRRVDQLNALQATIADVSAELELPRLLKAILQRAVNLCKADGGELGLLDEDQAKVKIVASYKMGKDYNGTMMQIGEGAMGMAIKMRRPVNIDEYPSWINASAQYQQGEWHAVLAVPFIIGKRIVGVIGIVDRNPGRRFSTSDQYLLSLFAQHAAIAVEKARLYQSAREAADRAVVLHQVSQAIVAASLQPAEIYSAIHDAAAKLMPAEAFVITRYQPGANECVAVYQVDRDVHYTPTSYPANQGLFYQVLSAGRTVYIPDILETDFAGRYLHFGNIDRVRSVLAAPMRSRGEIVGMISTQTYFPNGYTQEDRSLLEMLAAYAAIALENAGLFQNIQQLAITDPLTEVFNRRKLFELGQREFLRARRFARPLSVLMIDIDHFKSINDRFGHMTGDRVLEHLADAVRSGIREIDIVGRYGGEEFTVVLPEAALETSVEVANRLKEQVRSAFLVGSLPQITISIGAAALNPTTADFTSLVHSADKAMYAAKNAGRDRVMTDSSS